MTESFLQFVLDVIRRECAGLKAEVYDEREKSLTWIIDSKLAALSGVTVLVSLPRIDRLSGEPAAGYGHRISVLVVLRCKPSLVSGVSSYELAERLYCALDGNRWPMPGCELGIDDIEPNTQSDQLRSQSEKDDALHTFTVSAQLQFQPPAPLLP